MDSERAELQDTPRACCPARARDAMARAFPISLLLHGLLLAALSVWLTGTTNVPPDSPLPTINLRLDAIADSNRAERQEDSDSGLKAPTAVDEPQGPSPQREAAPLKAAQEGANRHAAAATPSPTPAPAPAAPEPASVPERLPATPATRTLEEAGQTAPVTVATVAPSGTAAMGAAARPAAAPRTIPLSSEQERMLEKKLERWSANLERVAANDARVTWRHGNQEYTATFTALPATDDTGLERVVVEVSTEQNGARLSTELRMRRLAFSNFAQFVDRWDPSVQIHDDELDGRFHANSEISLLYDRKVTPRFHGKVTTASRQINTNNSRGRTRRDAIFLGGLETGVRRISLPREVLPFPPGTASERAVIKRFDGDTRITFYSNGTFGWRAAASNAAEQIEPVAASASYLLGEKKVKLYLKGRVNGKVLVYAPDRIIIEGNLIYADYPDVGPDSDDYLGLVSDKYVEIAPPDVTGPGDLLINAAIYAKRRFIVRRYRARENAMLLLYGSLTAGSLSATEPRYYTRIRFDERLENLRPPRFPMSDRYEMEAWDGQWTAASGK